MDHGEKPNLRREHKRQNIEPVQFSLPTAAGSLSLYHAHTQTDI